MAGHEVTTRAIRIPAVLNATILMLAGLTAAALLWWASQPAPAFSILAAAVGFSFVNNTLFSLLHEATHGILHPNRRANDFLGRLAAAFYPTAFSVQRAFHLTHHKRNRSEFEQFDYLRPEDNKFLKYAQWYSILTGLYWLFPPVFCVLYSLAPGPFRARWLAHRESTVGHQTGASVYLGSLRNVPITTIRVEVLATLVFQCLLWWLLDLTLAGWALCYAFFAVNWSALQYADHAWSPLDRREGAWNLKVNALVKALFLNYHDHLAHHRNPNVPWTQLPALVRPDEPRPAFLSIYWRMWRGPRPIREADATTPVAERV